MNHGLFVASNVQVPFTPNFMIIHNGSKPALYNDYMQQMSFVFKTGVLLLPMARRVRGSVTG